MINSDRRFLRHTVATVAYRGAKAISGAPEDFALYKASPTTKTPVEILAHIGDLFEWALILSKGETDWKVASVLEWTSETARFFECIRQFDSFLAGDDEIHPPLERLFQGPIADALTHVGQIAMLRRIYGSPIKGENYFKAQVEIGSVVADSTRASSEFD